MCVLCASAVVCVVSILSNVHTIYSYYVHKPYYNKAVSFKKKKVKYIKE